MIQGVKSQKTKLNLHTTVYNIAREMYQKETEGMYPVPSFTKYVNRVLLESIQARETLQHSGVFKFIAMQDNRVIIYDTIKSKPVEVQIKGPGLLNNLHCKEDNTNNCTHTGFCYAIPKLYDIVRLFHPGGKL